MKLNRIAKSVNSTTGNCPSVYVTDDPDTLVIQGHVLDAETRDNLVEVVDGEDAITIPTETILRAAAKIRGGK